MKKILPVLQKAENGILAATFITMTLAAFAQVVNRNIIHASVSWFEELSRYCMVYMALLAAETGLRDGTQISVTAVTEMFNGKSRGFLELIAKMVVIVFSVIVFITSFEILKTQITSGQMSPGLKLPMYLPYFALPLSFGIISIVQIAIFTVMAGDLVRKNKGGAL